MLKIAIDTGPLKSGDKLRGIGVYTRELIGALESIQKSGSNKFDLYPVDYLSHQTPSTIHYNVVHFTRFNPFRISVPFGKPEGTKFVLTIYDLIPLMYPDHYPPGIRGKICWQLNKFLIKKNIDSIITISESSKKDICRFIGIKPEKVYVTYLAPRSIFRKMENENCKLEISKRYGLPDHFALYVGDINYNKNIPLLLKACRLAEIPLVICGRQAKVIKVMDLNHPELSHIKNLDWNYVTRLGFVSDEDLVMIYNLADVYIQPSFYEGFGLPLLEANASGCPVVASKTQALVEIAENVAIFVNPENADKFADNIKLVLSDSALKEDLIKKGLENAKKYSWVKTAEETLKVYHG